MAFTAIQEVKTGGSDMNTRKTVFSSAVVLYFIIGLEILIMISPFAGFFYSVFKPFLLELAKYPATKWLSAFFLPHMIVPPDGFLKFIRVMGSILFVGGMGLFFICALQVYSHKFLKKGAVLKGLYSYIRHPQYLNLAVAGIGLSILWPRFLVIVLWLAMVLMYYFLAKDEERRMLNQYGDSYREHIGSTGMFLPKRFEEVLLPSGAIRKLAVFCVLVMIVLGGAFSLRAYTIRHLPLWNKGNVTAISIADKDRFKMDHRMGDVISLEEIRKRLDDNKVYLVYFLPQNYIMQGLIADTGGEWKLYKQHHTISMITDWIFHPFRHLEEGHHAMHTHAHSAEGNGVVRRLIFLKIDNTKGDKPYDAFAVNAVRIPGFMADIDIHNLKVLELKELSRETGWGQVPTPVF
ncbi:MAG: isoprenylcysteine carboxylmethyltransferase family protein [Nitrospiraceae bacterium]|nr:MAG: isoprenylcysteine carboxylmethyltransferase family protein [Nitrospiraceae bacterium]